MDDEAGWVISDPEVPIAPPTYLMGIPFNNGWFSIV
jgi:hypothetical protein